MARQIIYYLYNCVYLIASLWLLFFLGMYINGKFIPDSLKIKNGKLDYGLSYTIFFVAIIIVEAVILARVMYFVNKQYSSTILRATNNKIAIWTAYTYFLLIVVLVIVSVIMQP